MTESSNQASKYSSNNVIIMISDILPSINSALVSCSNFDWIRGFQSNADSKSHYYVVHPAFRNIAESNSLSDNLGFIKMICIVCHQMASEETCLQDLVTSMKSINEHQLLSVGILLQVNSFSIIKMKNQKIIFMEQFSYGIVSYEIISLIAEVQQSNPQIGLYDRFFLQLQSIYEGIEYVSMIGEGTFGKVFKLYHPYFQMTYALKIIIVDSSHILHSKDTLLQQFINEYGWMRHCSDHDIDNVVKVVNLSSEMLKVEQGDQALLGYVMEEVGEMVKKPLTPAVRLILIQELAKLHSHRILHGDARPQNLLKFQFIDRIEYKWIDISNSQPFGVENAVDDFKNLIVTSYDIVESFIPDTVVDLYKQLLVSNMNMMKPIVENIWTLCESEISIETSS